MAICFPFIKYFYILILFIFSFIGLYSQSIEIIGFGSLFAIQTIYTLFLLLDILQDGNRGSKTLDIQINASEYTAAYKLHIPLWWILVAGSALQFTSSLLMIITSAFLYKKFQAIKVSRDNRGSIQTYKAFFLITTILMFLLTYAYVSSYNGGGSETFSNAYRLMFVGCFLGIIIFSSTDMYLANNLSKLIGSTIDG